MTTSILFWVLMLISLVFGFASWRGAAGPYGPAGNSLLLFILLLLLGWQVFGAPIR
jgi:hypothetical protein